jgi:hypothetical protein
MNSLFRTALAIATLAGGGTLHATIAVASNLAAETSSGSLLYDSHGVPLSIGCRVQLATFGEATPAQITGWAAQGAGVLLGHATTFGQPAAIGDGSEQAGAIEFQSESPQAVPTSGLHAIVLNAPTAAAATELLLLKLGDTLPGDDASGLPGYLTAHFEDAELVFGGTHAGGFSTAASPAGFDAWIATALGTGRPAGDYLPDADPDHDGLDNLLEYALGSQPSAGASLGRLHLHRLPDGSHQVRYLRRNDDSALLYQPEHSTTLEGSGWQPLASPAEPLAAGPHPAPAGFQWIGQALPPGDGRFVRMRVTRPTPPTGGS